MRDAALAVSRVLVTGASGFLGSHLSDRLRGSGAEVHAVSRSHQETTEGIRWIRSALDSADEVARVLRAVRPDIVYHLGGHATAAPDSSNVLPAFSSLLASTVYVLLHATEVGCRRIVLAGSFTEPADLLGVPSSPYAAAKLGASVYARMFRELYQTPVVTARVFMTYGPRQKQSHVVPYVVSSLLKGRSPRLSSGALAADWIYIDDVIDGLLAAASLPHTVAEEIDLGTGKLTTVREVVGGIVEILKSDVRPEFGALPDRPREVVRAADVERTSSILGWRATTSLASGLERTIAAYRQHLHDAPRRPDAMKVVLFCGGLGLRIRDASDAAPKPLVAIGNRPILWHVMKYYAHYGHREFILCLGHKGDAIKAYFHSANVDDWRITFADTGVLANIGQRLSMVKTHLEREDVFLCNYADGLTDLHLPDLIDAFQASDKVGALLCTRPALSYHFVRTSTDGAVIDFEGAHQLDLRINGGYFVFRKDIFDYILDGEDLVDEPFQRLIRANQLFGYRHDGFWRTMDTFKDKLALEDLYASGRGALGHLEAGPIVIELNLRRDRNAPINILCLGAHSDDIEIGCGGTILQLTAQYPAASVGWIVFSSDSDDRKDEAIAGAGRFLQQAAEKRIVVKAFRESFFPYSGAQIKEYFEELKSADEPDLVLTHYRFDLHQDHKVICDLTWNTFRRSLILEYEIPKWDGDLGTPNCYVRLSDDVVEQKIRGICETFTSQSTKPWFTADTFKALMRLRGVEANARFAEAFYARKLALA